jgi:hypothetical protein
MSAAGTGQRQGSREGYGRTAGYGATSGQRRYAETQGTV